MKIRLALIPLFTVAASATGLLLYKERTRTIEGTWLFMFEGSDFFEGATPEKPCGLYKRSAAWLNYMPHYINPDYSYRNHYPSSGSYRSPNGVWRLEAFSIRFVGRQKFALFGTGHMRSWSSEFEVDKLLSIKPITGVRCYVVN